MAGAPEAAAYHWEIGRETTAPKTTPVTYREAYHWEIGRETTARLARIRYAKRAYHWEIGRETTATPVAAVGF